MEPTADVFRSALQDGFVVEHGEARIELRLGEVQSLGDGYAEREAFALTFLGPVEPLLSQATYRLVHEGLGALDVFIVPVARDAGAASYEAIFT